MHRILGLVALLCAGALIFFGALHDLSQSERTAADLVLHNGVVYTLDDANPTARAIAVRGGRIVEVADSVRRGWIGPATRVLDLEGACVVPGLVDAHAHLRSLGLARERVDLVGSASFAEVVERIAAKAATTPPGEWIKGRGWDQNDWPRSEFGGEFPTHDALSAAVPDHPVVLGRVDGHASLLNRKALELCEITRASVAPAGGAIPTKPSGEPTGVLVDAAMGLARTPSPSRDAQLRALKRGASECLSLGLVGIHDAGVSREVLGLYEQLYRDGALPFRVYAMLRPGAARALRTPWVGRFDGLLTARAVKRFMDGALGSRGAFLLSPYSDAPRTQGLPQLESKALARETRELLDLGFQTCAHAIGDGGVRRVLDAYQLALAGDRSQRLRVEHAQVIAPSDLPRFASLGVLPSMQPTHCTSDMPWAEARLGPRRVLGAYAWQRLRAAGVEHLPLGSDFPVEQPDPLLGLYAAVTRLAPDGTSPHGEGGWYPDQRLTRLQALRGFTVDAAYAAFQETHTGTITPGKWADLAVFDTDLMTCPAPSILAAKVRYTVVAGRVAYEGR